jgi:antagonist of KipI
MALLVKKSGILTTVQDLGRIGSKRFGINPNGVMDMAAARLINIVLGNDENSAAVLELHFPAGELEFDADTILALGGADFGAQLDGHEVPMWSTVAANKGSVLKFTKRFFGNRAYLSVKSGFAVDDWLGSSSTNLIAKLGGYHGRKLAAGDRLECGESSTFKSLTIGGSTRPRYSRFPTVRVIAGAEFEGLTAISERAFLNEGFALTNDSDRMGFRLLGKPLHLLHSKEIVSSAVSFGTIQLLPDGQMVILMADHQTSGGYPRIGNVVSVDLPILAQLGPGDKVGFHLVSIEEAERLALRFERDLCFLKLGCRFAGI